jgi:hypothetical protein
MVRTKGRLEIASWRVFPPKSDYFSHHGHSLAPVCTHYPPTYPLPRFHRLVCRPLDCCGYSGSAAVRAAAVGASEHAGGADTPRSAHGNHHRGRCGGAGFGDDSGHERSGRVVQPARAREPQAETRSSLPRGADDGCSGTTGGRALVAAGMRRCDGCRAAACRARRRHGLHEATAWRSRPQPPQAGGAEQASAPLAHRSLRRESPASGARGSRAAGRHGAAGAERAWRPRAAPGGEKRGGPRGPASYGRRRGARVATGDLALVAQGRGG